MTHSAPAKNCSCCRYWKAEGKQKDYTHGTCRRHAPSGEYSKPWARTWEYDWCGDWGREADVG